MLDRQSSFFKGKKITLLGLGLLGRGVGDAAFLAECGATVLVTDRKSEAELAESVAQLKQYENVSFRFGEHRAEDFTNCDMVIKAAGVRLDSPEVAAARKAGVPVYMSTALFAKYAHEAGATIVGVTGTRGKSTIAHMIHYALARAERRTHLGGNVRGVSTLALLPQIQKGDIAVLELDSWQLQGFGDLQISPEVAIFTNLMPDHLNYYPDMETYFNDKAQIFKYQKPDDVLFVGEDIAERVRTENPPVTPMMPSSLPETWWLAIPGEHNRSNAAFAAATLKHLGLSEGEIKDGLESFSGVEGRLQLVADTDGIQIYNDNNATTPEATIAALKALPAKKIVLLMGGADKGLDTRALSEAIDEYCKHVVLLAGTGTDAFLKAHEQLSMPQEGPFDSLAEAVKVARAACTKGDVFLFSPAFASFGMFKNEYDRNDQFLKALSSR